MAQGHCDYKRDLFTVTWGKYLTLGSATQHAMPPEFGGKWGAECHNTGFPRPDLPLTGYSVKMTVQLLFITQKNNLKNIIIIFDINNYVTQYTIRWSAINADTEYT